MQRIDLIVNYAWVMCTPPQRWAVGASVDAHLVVLAVRTGHSIITSGEGDFIALAGHLGAAAPKIHRRQPTGQRGLESGTHLRFI